jgi:hypothetical protein
LIRRDSNINGIFSSCALVSIGWVPSVLDCTTLQKNENKRFWRDYFGSDDDPAECIESVVDLDFDDSWCSYVGTELWHHLVRRKDKMAYGAASQQEARQKELNISVSQKWRSSEGCLIMTVAEKSRVAMHWRRRLEVLVRFTRGLPTTAGSQDSTRVPFRWLPEPKHDEAATRRSGTLSLEQTIQAFFSVLSTVQVPCPSLTHYAVSQSGLKRVPSRPVEVGSSRHVEADASKSVRVLNFASPLELLMFFHSGTVSMFQNTSAACHTQLVCTRGGMMANGNACVPKANLTLEFGENHILQAEKISDSMGELNFILPTSKHGWYDTLAQMHSILRVKKFNRNAVMATLLLSRSGGNRMTSSIASLNDDVLTCIMSQLNIKTTTTSSLKPGVVFESVYAAVDAFAADACKLLAFRQANRNKGVSLWWPKFHLRPFSLSL